MTNYERIMLLVFIVLGAALLWLLINSRGRAQVECYPEMRRVEQALTNLEVVRVEDVRQTELLKEIREILKARKP